MGGFFHQDITPDDFKNYMLQWCLPWKLGDVELPQMYYFNYINIVYRNRAPNFISAYDLQSSRVITDIGQNNCLYSNYLLPPTETATPVALTQAREGCLGCLANLPVEGQLVNIVLKICGL